MGNEVLKDLTVNERRELWMSLRHRAAIVRIHKGGGIYRDRALVMLGETLEREREWQRQSRVRRVGWLPAAVRSAT